MEPQPGPTDFRDPADIDTRVWRYMDIGKYISMLDRKSFYFCRVDLFGDQHEGALTKKEFNRIKEISPGILELISRAKANRSRHYAICWHMNKHESDAMWQLYCKSEYSIAIQSTYKKLKHELEENSKNPFYLSKPRLGCIEYIDYSDENHLGTTFSDYGYFLRKRKSFKHEEECRAIISASKSAGLENPEFHEKAKSFYSLGEELPVAIENLIESVVINPKAPKQFIRTIETLTNMYGYHFDVRESSLSDAPLL